MIPIRPAFLRRAALVVALLAPHALARHALAARAAPARTTLEAVDQAGELACGAVAEPEDWTKSDLHAGLAPLEIEICKAVSVAALGTRAKLAMHVYASAFEAAEGLRRGEIQLVAGVTPSLTAMWRDRIRFGLPFFFDGQSVLLRGDNPARSVDGLAGVKVCYVEGTENENVVLARTVARGIAILPFPFQEEGEMEDGLSDRHCDAISAYVSRLALERASDPKALGHDRILDDWMTIAPVATATRDGDRQWSMIVDATVSALIEAEASGVTRADVGRPLDRARAADPSVQRLLGSDWASARALGLADHAWAAKVIGVVGNYGEIYDRTIGASLHLPRGRNALWTRGGLLVPLAVQ